MSRLLVIALLCFGCDGVQDLQSSKHALNEVPTLILSKRVWTSPPGGTDGAPHYEMAWQLPNGTVEAIDVPPVTHAVQWGSDAVYVDTDHTLWMLGDESPIAADVWDTPAVSLDNSTLAYVRSTEKGVMVNFRSRQGEVGVLSELINLGAIRFAPDGKTLVGIGSANSGVAGLHAVDLEGSRCLTNCDLRVGKPWGDQYIAPPSSASEWIFEGELLTYQSANKHSLTTRRWTR